jgi:hypothetical protein
MKMKKKNQITIREEISPICNHAISHTINVSSIPIMVIFTQYVAQNYDQFYAVSIFFILVPP